jgi:Tol biopolymer transport system component
MKYILFIILLFTLFFNSCGDSNIEDPGNQPLSDLTRTGKFISFTSNKDGNHDVYLAEVNNSGQLVTSGFIYPSNPYNLTSSNPLMDMQSNWSPDGRVLIYSNEISPFVRSIYAYFFAANGRLDSTVMQNPRVIFPADHYWDENPSFSPDGKYLIWDRRYDNAAPPGIDPQDSRDLYIADVTGKGDSMMVTNQRAIKQTTGNDEFNGKWSPRINVGRIAYEYRSSVTATDNDVYIIDPFNPSNNFVFYEPGKSGYPAWTPSCQSIVFETDQGNGGNYKISFKYYPSGTDITDVIRVTDLDQRYPTMRPNDYRLCYTRFESNGTGLLYVTLMEPPYNNLGVKLLPADFDNAVNIYPAW